MIPEHVQGLKGLDQFWKDVWKSWSEYNFLHERRVESQLIWYNSSILVEGRPIMWNDVYKRGLKYVYQLFEDKSFKNYKQVWEEYGLSMMRYNSLRKTIPKEWIDFFCSRSRLEYMPLPPHNYDRCVFSGDRSFSSTVYKYIA